VERGPASEATIKIMPAMLTGDFLYLMLVVVSASVSPLNELVSRQATYEGDLTQCPGYAVSNVKQNGATMTADLNSVGPACNAYGTDIEHLSLEVTYDTGSRHPGCINNVADGSSVRNSYTRQDFRRKQCGLPNS
jgi:hypothetical protein